MSEEQTKQLERALRPVAGRLRQAALRPRLVRAVFLGAAAALVPALLHLFTGRLGWGVVGLLVLIGVPLVTLGLALAAKPNFRRAALAVDLHYGWQDRITTAWSALSVGGLTPLEQYQAQDAVGRLAQVSPVEVVPLTMPVGIWKSAGFAVVVLCALVGPIGYHREKPKPVVIKPVEATPREAAKPAELAPLPAVSPELAAASFSARRDEFSQQDDGSVTQPPYQDSPAPNRRLIREYFEAVCPPGR